MIATTIEQSNHLLELGMPKESANMCYTWQVIDKEYFPIPVARKAYDDELPAWSLAALLNFLPEKIEPFYYISLEKYVKGYRIAYLYTIGGELQHLIQYTGETAIDVTYDMVCTILENKLKKDKE